MKRNSVCKIWLSRSKSLFGFVLVALIFFGSFTENALAQAVPKSTTPLAYQGTAIGGIENIDYFTGNVTINIPIAKVGGRGEASFTMMYTVGDEGWRVDMNRELTYCPVPGNPQLCLYRYYYYPNFGRDINGSFKAGLGPGVMRAMHTGRYTTPCPPGQQEGLGERLTTLTFAMPGGSSVELRDRQYEGKPLPGAPCQGPSNGPSRGTIFDSKDGSGMTFVSDTVIEDKWYPGPESVSGTLYLRNGVRYRIDNGGVSRITDRNGNWISFAPLNVEGYAGYVATDSLGRQTTVQSDDVTTTVTIPGKNNTTRMVRMYRNGQTLNGCQQQTYGQAFPELNGAVRDWNNALVGGCNGGRLELPDGREYRFYYNNYLDLARVELPTGAAYEYSWNGAGTASGAFATGTDYDPRYNDARQYYGYVYRRLTERRVYEGGGSGANFTAKQTMAGGVVRNYGAGGTTPISRTDHFFYGSPTSSIDNYNPFYNQGWSSGLEYRTDVYAGDGAQLLNRTLREYQQRGPVSWYCQWNQNCSATQVDQPANDPRLTDVVSVIFENGKAVAGLSRTEYDLNGSTDPTYFSHFNVKRTKGYNFKPLDIDTASQGTFQTVSGMFSEDDLVAIAETDYLYDANYKARYIHGLATETRILNPSDIGKVLSKSQFVYDESAYFDNNYTTTNWENPNSNLRGNVTTTKTWFEEEERWITSHAMFDNFGNVRKVWDTSNDASRFIETEYDPIYKYAYPTKTKAPAPDPTGLNGTNQGSEISRTYDFNTGLLLSVTDANGQTATTEYDSLLRVKKITPPPGGSVSEMFYNDTPGSISVKSMQQIDENNWAESTTFYDNLGRAVKTRTKDLQGDVMSQVKFDSFGRVEKTSNPYRVDAEGVPTETVYWSKVRYDNQGRVVETYAPAPEGQTGQSLGTVQFGISDLNDLIGTYVVATDASGRKSRAISGIYGLMRVDEATAKGGSADQDLGTLANPTQPTYYDYNIKGELVKITQGNPSQQGQPIQYRYFMYDSFGRLIRVRQPEQTPNPILATTGNPDNNQWTAAYSYDVFGNVIGMTDAKNTTITNFYDKAGRTVKRAYSDSTPQVEYFYDGEGLPSTPPFSKGALTKVTSSVSEDRFTGFDNHGRLLASQQITDGQTYDFGYKYNLSGGLIEQTYPSGRIVRNFLDIDGGLNVVTSKPGNGITKRVASDFDYSATGAVKKMKLGNGLWETAVINELNQLKQVGLGTTQTNKDLFKIDYEYGELNDERTEVDTTKNIGMIARTTTTIPTTSFVQTFKYDSINRLKEARETTGGQQNWIQSFVYDRFGNRTQFSQTIGTSQLPINNITHPTINQADNRFTTGQGYTYDFNGNLIQDAQNRGFAFNGDDKQSEVRDLNVPTTPQNPDADVIGRYFYDGSGARVKKFVPSTGETTIFVYDAGGAVAAEYSTVVAPVQEAKTSYLTTDHLGSPRVITDAAGQVTARRDFMPFGEELGIGVGGRTEGLKYSNPGTDKVRKRFTGYEKDDETGLDFAEARMYQNKHGRFTAPDPLLASASATNPQTFNRYTYTGNDPVNRTDPSGLNWCRGSNGVSWTGFNTPCAKGEEDAGTLGEVEISRTGRTNNGYWLYEGQTVVFDNATGTVRVVRDVTLQHGAVTQGKSVAEAAATTPGQTAAGAAASSAAEGGNTQLPTAPAPTILPLCTPEYPCGGGSPVWSNPLSQGASAEEILFVAQTGLDGAAASEIPILSQAAGLGSAGIDIYNGDWTSAGLGIGGLVPIAGNYLDALKIARRLDKARELGKAGERAAGISDAPKKAIQVDGRNLFPDEITDAALIESKNVAKLSFTRQLRDYNKHAKANKLDFILWTRSDTKLSGPLQRAINGGEITRKCFDGPCL